MCMLGFPSLCCALTCVAVLLLTWTINPPEGGKCQETGKASGYIVKVHSKGFGFKLEKVDFVVSANIP